jgi:hypothetical protein
MPDPTEQRSEKRISHTAKTLKIKSASGVPALANKELEGATINISASGLQIILNSAIPLKSTIDVWITLEDGNTQHFLSGEVRWCNEAKTNEFHIGVLLKNRTDIQTDYAEWRNLFK